MFIAYWDVETGGWVVFWSSATTTGGENDMIDVIVRIASDIEELTGVPASMQLANGYYESRLDPTAKNPDSSADGIHQIVDSTDDGIAAKYAGMGLADFGTIEHNDIAVQMLGGALLMQETLSNENNSLRVFYDQHLGPKFGRAMAHTGYADVPPSWFLSKKDRERYENGGMDDLELSLLRSAFLRHVKDHADNKWELEQTLLSLPREQWAGRLRSMGAAKVDSSTVTVNAHSLKGISVA